VGSGGDCDDADPLRHPGAVEVCDGIDADCDGVIDDNPSDGSAWYLDSDGDGYGGSSRLLACTNPAGYVSQPGDCDDSRSDVNPGALEQCNRQDDDCDGAADQGTPDLDGSGVADRCEVAIIASAGFIGQSSDSNECKGESAVDQELKVVATYLTELSLYPVRIDESSSTGVTYQQLAAYGLVIYNDEGWGVPPLSVTVSTLEQVRTDGRALLFMGDDLALQAENADNATGERFAGLLHLKPSMNNGTLAGAAVTDMDHPVMSGPFGAVEDFDYRDDMDRTSTTNQGEQVLMTIEGTTFPAVLAVEAAGQRTVTMLVVAYNTTLSCPISDGDGLSARSKTTHQSLRCLFAFAPVAKGNTKERHAQTLMSYCCAGPKSHRSAV